MTGFEVIVRPAILPNIRPPPPRVLLPEDDPEQGIVVLSGSGGKLIDLTQSGSASTSQSNGKQKETRRVYDVERIYNQDDDGKVDKSQYIDTERVKKITTRGADGVEGWTKYADPPQRDNVETRESNLTRISNQ